MYLFVSMFVSSLFVYLVRFCVFQMSITIHAIESCVEALDLNSISCKHSCCACLYMWGLHVYTEGLCTGDLHKGLCMGHKPGDIYMGAYKQVLVHGELRHGGPKDI